jgi:hypothetical protein
MKISRLINADIIFPLSDNKGPGFRALVNNHITSSIFIMYYYYIFY